MLTCPRCGSEAEYLADEVFPLVRCGFCGDDIDAADLALQAAVDHIVQALPSASPERQHPSVDTTTPRPPDLAWAARAVAARLADRWEPAGFPAITRA